MTQQIETLGNGNNMGISADTIAANLDRLIEEGTITDTDKHLILWFFGECRNRSLSLADSGKLIGYSSSTISRLFAARYEGKYTEVINKIKAYKHLSDERGRLTRDEFIETSVWHTVRKVCDLALIHQIPGMITGVSQIGKSTCLEEYRNRSHYTVRYVRMPAAPGFRGAIDAIAHACNVTMRATTEQLRFRLARSLDSKSLLIVDELHQLAISSGKHAAMKIMEYIRELMDISHCGLVVCGTKSVSEDLIDGELKGWLEQFKERIINKVELPNRISADDISLVATTYELPEPDNETLDLLRNIRMNRLIKTIMLARNLADNRKQQLDWSHFRQVYRTINPTA